MKRAAVAALLAAAAVLLFGDLGRPALWQDEAETALRAVSILDSGLPRATVRGVLVTTQPSLAKYEANAEGVWTWNTWLPAYLCAASFAVLGPSAFAARLPFALAGLLALWLWWDLCARAEDENGKSARRAWAPEAALALLALSPAFLLFCRQSRYYALVALGTALVLRAWRRLVRDERHGALALALALNFLFHAAYAFFFVAAAALALDATARGREAARARRYWTAAALTAVTVAPAALYFRVWSRPGNHLYGSLEAFEFLKTFLLWLAAFAVPTALVAAAFARRGLVLLASFAALCALIGEGAWSLVGAASVLAALFVAARRETGLVRACLLWTGASLALLSFGAAEPYGRYLAGVLPPVAYLTARALSSLGRGRAPAVAGLCALALAGNFFFVLPLKAAALIGAPLAPADSVSGMARARLRAVPFRSDLLALAREEARGARGYDEAAASEIREGGGETFFSDADSLPLMFMTGKRPLTPDEYLVQEPDWILASPWMRLSPALAARTEALFATGRYAGSGAYAPALLWQNNPDPLMRDFAPAWGPLPLLQRRPASAKIAP